MTRSRARSPWSLTFVRCLRSVALPTLGAAVAGALLQRVFTPPAAGLAAAPGALTPWLQLPLLVAAAGTALVTATFWPLFATGRPGREQIERLQRGPFGGAGGAIAGALLAQLVLTLPLTLGFARLLGAPALATAHFELRPDGAPLLDATRPQLSFALDGLRLAELRLRPLATLPTGAIEATRVQVRLDGEPVAGEVRFAESRQFERLALPARAAQTLSLQYVAGTVPLVFLPGTVEAVEARVHSGLWNGIAAAAIYLLPSFVALALALLCGRTAALATVWTAIGGLLFVQTVGGVGPADDAVLALLRGRWLATFAMFWQCVPSLAAGSLAMIATMLLRRRLRR